MHLGGLYYDGNEGTRDVQQRIRRMTETLPPTNGTLAVFDVHGRAFDYVEELPFFDSMWTCEGIDFTKGSGECGQDTSLVGARRRSQCTDHQITNNYQQNTTPKA